MLILIIIIFLIGYWVGKDSSSKTPQPPQNDSYWLQRIINALVFTAQEEQNKTKSKATKNALQRVIDAGYNEQYGYVPGHDPQPTQEVSRNGDAPWVVDEHSPQPDVTPAQSIAEAAQANYQQGPRLVQQTPRKQDLDNTSLLLYFGAFLFITSIGLFVAFSDFDGTFRTFMVGVVAFVLYSIGFWLHESSKKLQEVGLTFLGIGMSSLPFIGLAAYYYVTDEEYGPAIWLTTSVATVVVYAITLFRIRNTFISYMLIGSLVSLFQSSVSVIEAPAYYYLWMLMAVGIVLHFISLISKNLPELQDSSAQSSRVLIPLSIVISLLVIGTEGTWQFAVTLLIASAYYGLQYFVADKDKEYYALGSHMLLIGGVAVGAYSLNESIRDVSSALILVTAVHTIAAMLVSSVRTAVAVRFVDVALLTAITTTVIALNDSLHLTIAFALQIVLGLIVTITAKRHDSFVLTLISWVLFSVVLGQVLPDERISEVQQALLSFGFSLPLVLLLHVKAIREQAEYWFDSVRVSVIALHSIAMIFAFVDGEYSVIWLSLASIATVLVLAETLRDRTWAGIAVMYSLVPSLYVVFAALDDELRALPLFTLSVVAALFVNILIALRHKLESSRWASTAGWLALPFALGIEEIGDFDLSASLQMWLYLAAGIALSISRAIARGRFMVSKNVPMESLDKERSVSYATGLGIATITAIVLAFLSTQTVAESSLVILLAGMILIVGGTLIEREPQYVAFTPFILQLVLLRALEPYDSASWITHDETLFILFAFLSSAVAMLAYGWSDYALKNAKSYLDELRALKESSITTLFVAPLSFILVGEVVWAMPVALMVAAAVLMYDQWNQGLGRRESVGLLGTFGLLWLLFVLGVEYVQIYTHIVAAVFALYAYVRFTRKDEKSEEYFGYMAAVATIPLALHALSTGSDRDAQLFMVWLFFECLVLWGVGKTIKSTILRQWGLYGGLATLYGLLYVFGVTNIQAYSHLTAAILAFFGYLSYRKGDQIQANQYWGSMLAVATIPLALQALGAGEDARFYGIWLLLENIAFFLIGITVRNTLITRWGLYFAIAVVLYELRDLGWAMLAILALVLIGIGAYRATKQPDDEPEKK